MSSFDWKATVGTVAPMLAGMLGTPVAGIAVKALCGVLGLEATPENAQKAAEQIAAGQLTGDQLIALKKAEADAQFQLQKAGMDYDLGKEQLVQADVANARAREIQVRDKTPAIGFYATSVGFFGLLALLSFHAAPAGSRDLLNIMVGALGLAWGNEVKYYYGGNNGDSKLHDMLFRSTPPAAGGGN